MKNKHFPFPSTFLPALRCWWLYDGWKKLGNAPLLPMMMYDVNIGTETKDPVQRGAFTSLSSRAALSSPYCVSFGMESHAFMWKYDARFPWILAQHRQNPFCFSVPKDRIEHRAHICCVPRVGLCVCVCVCGRPTRFSIFPACKTLPLSQPNPRH